MSVNLTNVYRRRNPDSKEIPPGSECRGAVWIVDEWMETPYGRVQGRAHWHVPEGYSLSFPEGDFERPLAVRA